MLVDFLTLNLKGFKMSEYVLEAEEDISIDIDVDLEDNEDLIGQIGEIDNLSRQAISNYFLNKEMYTGELIEKSLIHLPYYISLVRNTSVSEGVLKAYRMIEDCDFKDTVSINKSSMAEDVKFVLSLIKKIQRKVSQEFVGGILLMHLELIEGIEIW